jgi:hypothetical protein
MPTAYATTYLAWGLFSFQKGYGSKADEVYENVKAGADFIMSSYMDDDKLVVQVGAWCERVAAGSLLHVCWWCRWGPGVSTWLRGPCCTCAGGGAAVSSVLP